MDFYSPLRYPGGKGKVAEYFKQVIKENLLFDGVYVEPYAGGASVGLSLLFNEYVTKIIINDNDISIYTFWHCVLNETETFCKLISKTPVSVATWEKQKKIQKDKHNQDLLSLGFSTFFLNRTNRSGIINAGVIGGKDQTGEWKIDARFNKVELIKRIKKIALYKDKIELYNLDAVKLIKTLKPKLPTKTLFYFDPPYYVKGKDLYLNHYEQKDHKAISLEIGKISKQKWIITYDNVSAIQELYTDFRSVNYSLNYSAAKANKGQEIMVFSDNLYMPMNPKLSLLPVN